MALVVHSMRRTADNHTPAHSTRQILHEPRGSARQWTNPDAPVGGRLSSDHGARRSRRVPLRRRRHSHPGRRLRRHNLPDHRRRLPWGGPR